MIGKFLSSAIKIVTLPIDAVEIGFDMVTGGDGSRRQLKSVMPQVSDLRDKICDAAKEADE